MEQRQPERRDTESTDFLLEILDGREEIINDLKRNFTTAEVTTGNYVACFTPPENLASFLTIDGQPADITINTHVLRHEHEGRDIGLVKMELIPEDRLPLRLTADHGLVTLEQGDMTAVSDYQLFRKLLESIFVEQLNDEASIEDLDDASLLDAILTLSPNLQRLYTFNYDDVEQKINISFLEEEAETDTVDSVSIELLRPHPCGAEVGTHLTIRESLTERSRETDSQSTKHNSDVLARFNSMPIDEKLTVEAILRDGDSNKRVPLRSLTRYHMADIYDALHMLRLTK